MPAVAVAVFEGAEELDVVGPWEVLAARRYLHRDEVSVCLVGNTLEPVTSRRLSVRARPAAPSSTTGSRRTSCYGAM